MRRDRFVYGTCACALALTLTAHATRVHAQEAESDEQQQEQSPVDGSSDSDNAQAQQPSSDEPVAPSPAQTAAASSSTGVVPQAAAVSVSSAASSTDTIAKDEAKASSAPESNHLVTGSHIRRATLMPDDALVIDSPLSTEIQNRDYLQTRRQLGGIAAPDTTAALGHSKRGGPNTDLYELRLQPTLVLLNGRRMISAPYFRTGGADYVDINQVPLQLIERIEISRGMSAGLYGDGAIGGTVNFITRRNYSGIEVDVGGQTTDKFDQSDKDIALTLGTGSEETGMNVMVSYFNRTPLAASDRDWIHQRTEQVESLTGSPASFQQSSNFDYPFPDPSCDIAQKAGHSAGLQTRLRGYYGPPNILQPLVPPMVRDMLLMTQDVARSNTVVPDGVIDPLETSTYCATNFTSTQDLILKDERVQTYSTFWHKFSQHTEGYGEIGYYRTDNSNRTAPSFPIDRVTADVNHIYPVWIPTDHADQPVPFKGFAAVETPVGRVANDQFIVGRVDGLYAGSNVNERHVDVFRGVLGLKGDLKGVGANSILETWDWDVSSVYSRSESYASVPDVLMDKLGDALRACSATKMDQDRNVVPTTIKERQEAGCYNPFYSSVTNSAALDPLGVSKLKAPSQNGFVTTDTDKPGQKGYGVQDGGYICDPNDPNSPPCPAQFDRNGDGVFELAGTVNTKQNMDRLFGQQTTVSRRSLATVDGVLQGDIVKFADGGLSFGLGGQFRREAMSIDYDAAYNHRQYAFLFGAPDVPNTSRNVGAGFAELRVRLLKGLVEVQPAARIENVQVVGTAMSPLVGVAVRPFAPLDSPPPALEWLLLRGHIGRGVRAPSLMQMYGSQTVFEAVDFFSKISFVPHQIQGNPNLDFEKYTTISGGLQYDFAGIHVQADYWTTQMNNVIAWDNSQTLMRDCEWQYKAQMGDCKQAVLISGLRTFDHIESNFDNVAKVSSNGIDGGASYALDSKKRGLGDFGTFVVGVQGSYLNSYLISSPRALREYYRTGNQHPDIKNGVQDYSKLTAEYEAAGFRNIDNFAPPLPKLRFSVPIRWLYEGHVIGFTMRYIGSYNDDSETTIERYGIGNINDLANNAGTTIPSWTVFDVNYGYTFQADKWKLRLGVGVINLLDKAPPAVESPLGYEVGVHDPRGRMIYARATGSF